MYQAKKKFGGEINKYFDYTLFHYRPGSITHYLNGKKLV